MKIGGRVRNKMPWELRVTAVYTWVLKEFICSTCQAKAQEGTKVYGKGQYSSDVTHI